MTTEDKRTLMTAYRKRVKRGIPINISYATAAEQWEWLSNLLLEVVEKVMAEQEPLGITKSGGYDLCPACGGVIGNSAYYCKKCGAWIRGGSRT